jgi:hypothetical protein
MKPRLVLAKPHNPIIAGREKTPALQLAVLILLADSLKRFIVSLLVDKSPGFRIPFCPAVIGRVVNLRPVPDSSMSMPVTGRWVFCNTSFTSLPETGSLLEIP